MGRSTDTGAPAVGTDDDRRRCPTCDTAVPAPFHFCGRCGGMLPDRSSITPTVPVPHSVGRATADDTPHVGRSGAESAGAAPSAGAASPAGSGELSRRRLLAGAGLVLLGGVAGGLLTRRLGTQTTPEADGLPTAEVELGDARDLAKRLHTDGPIRIPDDGGRLAIVRWDPAYTSDGIRARDRYGPDGEGHPILDGETGFIVLSLVSTHLGCSVAYCDTSQWFEDPCHGTRWNAWGEWTGGPAPRGLDRFVSTIRQDGVLVADLTRHIVGPARDDLVFDQPQAGPSCIDG